MEGVSDLNAPLYPSDDCSPRPDRYSDADVASNYSSCDGSDFDRYCSANSVMGSASICSSIGNYSGIGEELPECYISRAKSYFSDGVAVTPRGNVDRSLNRMNASSSLHNESSSCHGICGEDNTVNSFTLVNSVSLGASLDEDEEKYEDKGILNVALWNRKNGAHLDHNTGTMVGIDAKEDVVLQSHLSESEDSILDYEADNECRIQFGERGFKPVEETKLGDVNPLLINSSIAFGSNDWDEFMEDGLASVPLHLDQSFQYNEDHDEKELDKGVGDISKARYEAEKLTVKDVKVGNCLPEINHDAQVIGMCTGVRVSNNHGVQNSNETVVVDQTAKHSEYVRPLGLRNAQYESNEVKWNINSMPDDVERKIQSSHDDGSAGKGMDEASEKTLNSVSELSLSAMSSRRNSVQSYSRLNGAGEEIRSHEPPLINTSDGSSIQKDQEKGTSSPHLSKANIQEGEIKKVDTYDSYDEMVHEMEEILLDSRSFHGSTHMQSNQGYVSLQSRNFRDGSSVASTSATDEMYPSIHIPSKIDRVEVIGAKQKKGDVSFGERLVGVREYTIYQMKVWSGTEVWMVERRYRDFFTLYRQLKAFFSGHGLSLPSAWSSVEQEARKIFGNASPNVVTERSILIEDCIRSILSSTFHFGTPSPLTIFLTPGKIMFKFGLLQSLVPQYLQKFAEDENSDCPKALPEDTSMLGKTISLVIEIKPHKSLRQLLEIQQYACAGCHRRLDAGKTLFRELIQTFGWSRPRFCEYTGQLFCASCHTNDTSVLPARVLHHWDFSRYPVSQLAKAYLESIYDQPMLCVSAVNPFLFSKVSALLQVMGFRKKIGAMFPYVNCSFRSSIQKSLGFRRHILENNDFFALRDLVDLSKGPFAALPVMVKNISDLILEHITQQCLICYDSGVACSARQACDDPSSLIFPFQETEAEKCTSCGSIFHKACYLDLLGCPCNNPTAMNRRHSPRETRMPESHSGPVGSVERVKQPLISNPATGFFTNILAKARSDIWKPKESSPVILMGSLPGSSL